MDALPSEYWPAEKEDRDGWGKSRVSRGRNEAEDPKGQERREQEHPS